VDRFLRYGHRGSFPGMPGSYCARLPTSRAGLRPCSSPYERAGDGGRAASYEGRSRRTVAEATPACSRRVGGVRTFARTETYSINDLRYLVGQVFRQCSDGGLARHTRRPRHHLDGGSDEPRGRNQHAVSAARAASLACPTALLPEHAHRADDTTDSRRTFLWVRLHRSPAQAHQGSGLATADSMADARPKLGAGWSIVCRSPERRRRLLRLQSDPRRPCDASCAWTRFCLPP